MEDLWKSFPSLPAPIARLVTMASRTRWDMSIGVDDPMDQLSVARSLEVVSELEPSLKAWPTPNFRGFWKTSSDPLRLAGWRTVIWRFPLIHLPSSTYEPNADLEVIYSGGVGSLVSYWWAMHIFEYLELDPEVEFPRVSLNTFSMVRKSGLRRLAEVMERNSILKVHLSLYHWAEGMKNGD